MSDTAPVAGETTDAGVGEVGNTDGPCEQCGITYPPWWVDHAIWNRTLGGPDAKGDPGGMLCPNCFLRRAEPVRGAWHITLPVKPADASTGASEGLSEAERESLWDAIEHAFLDTTTYSMGDEEAIDRAVERIVAARVSAAATRAADDRAERIAQAIEARIRAALPGLLVAEYGETERDWTELRSVSRIAKALANIARSTP